MFALEDIPAFLPDLLRGAYTDVDEGWRAFARTAVVARTLLAECSELGATVVRDATLDHLAAGMRSFPVVTLIAHMEFPRVSPDDVLDAATLQELVRHAPAPEWEWIQSEWTKPGDLSDLVAAMNRVLGLPRRDVMAARDGSAVPVQINDSPDCISDCARSWASPGFMGCLP